MKNKRTSNIREISGKSIVSRLANGLLILFSLLALNISSIRAQEAIAASGGNASGSSGSVSYTVGQIVYTTSTGTNGSALQGVQQPFEIYVVTAVEKAKGISLNIMAYPNPVIDFLQLKVETNDNISLSTLTFSLYDISGKLIEIKKVESNETNILMGNLAPSTYFLKVLQTKNGSSQQEIKTFRIIKK